MATTKPTTDHGQSSDGPNFLQRIGSSLRQLQVWSEDLAARQSTQFVSHRLTGPPITAIDGSVILGADKRWWFYVNLPVFAPYDHLAADTKENMRHQLTALLRSLVGYDFHLLTLPGRLNAQRLGEWWKQEESRHLPDDIEGREAYERRIDANVAALESHQYAMRVVRLGIRLRKAMPGKPTGYVDSADLAFFGLVNEQNARLLPELRELLGTIHASGFADATPMTEQALLQTILWTAWPGHPNRPPAIISNTDPESAEDHKLGYLADNNIVEKPRHLVIEPDNDPVYAAYLSLHRLPYKPVFPFNEYLRLIDIFGCPVPTSVRGRVVSSGAMEYRTRKILDDARAHHELLLPKNGPASLIDLDEEIAALALLHQHARAGEPTVVFTATAILTNPDLDELGRMRTGLLAEQSNASKGGRNDQGVGFIAGARIQLDLHYEAMPGSPVRVDSYTLQASADSVAAGMPLVSSLVQHPGTYVGHLTGWGEGGPLLIDPAAALMGHVDTSTVILLMGPPGEGKTVAGTTFGVILAMRGGVALIRDPKGDLDLLETPEGLRVERIDMSNFPGGLSPALLGTTPAEAREFMARFLQTAAGRYDEDTWASLYAAAKAEIDAHPYAPDFRNVITLLAGGSQLEQLIAKRLTPVADLAQARAFYGTQEEAAVLSRTLRPGLTIWGTKNWAYPDHADDESRWSPAERLTIAGLELQFLVGRKVTIDRNVMTYSFDDEFHLFGQLRVGRAIRLAARFGRSYQSLVALATQSWADLPPNLDSFVSLLLVFRQSTERDARIAAEALHLNPDDPSVISLIMHLGRDGGGKSPDLLGEALIGTPWGDVLQGRLDPELWLGKHGLETNTRRRAELGLRT